MFYIFLFSEKHFLECVKFNTFRKYLPEKVGKTIEKRRISEKVESSSSNYLFDSFIYSPGRKRPKTKYKDSKEVTQRYRKI